MHWININLYKIKCFYDAKLKLSVFIHAANAATTVQDYNLLTDYYKELKNTLCEVLKSLKLFKIISWI